MTTTRAIGLNRNLVVCLTSAVPALILAVGGIAKLNSPISAARFIHTILHWPFDLSARFVTYLGAFELIIAVLLCALAGASRIPGIIALLMCSAFMGLLAKAWLDLGPQASCGCFGDLLLNGVHSTIEAQMSIDLGLMVLLALHLLMPRDWFAFANRPAACG